MSPIDLAGYAVVDDFFGTPYIDVDEQRETPVPHRYLHGGFEGTTTRFAFSFPPADAWGGRMYQPLEGANAGHEDAFATSHGQMLGGLDMIVRVGGYMVETNMGHIGDVLDPKAGEDPTIYGWRAAAESGRLSKFVAAQIYGRAPRHSYVFGGSGGARRSPLCLQYAPDVWDAALPFMGDANVDEHGKFRLIRGGGGNFSSMFNVQRLLGSRLLNLVDAMSPGGSGDPFAGLSTHEREELANLYRLGFPRGDEWVIGQPSGVIWLWCSMADRLLEEDPEYFERFWTAPGYVGHDLPQYVDGDVIERTAAIERTFTPADFRDDPQFASPVWAKFRASAIMLGGMRGMNLPIAIQVSGIEGYKLGMGVRINTGAGAGRQMYVMYHQGDILLCDGRGENSNRRFRGVVPGDEVELNNRAFLAYCYYYRHHVLDFDEWQFLRLDGKAIYEQHTLPTMSPFMSVPYSGQYDGKLMWVHHTHDASLWPPQGIAYRNAVEKVQGPAALIDKFRLRWTENAEHVPDSFVPPQPGRASNTWLIDYRPVIEQCLLDLAAWVEDGVPPVGSEFSYHDGRVTLPTTAKERGGIQPVVTIVANGAERTEVGVGDEVRFHAIAETPPQSGTVVSVQWDFDGSGLYSRRDEAVDGTTTRVEASTTYRFDKPGTYFVTALVHSHRDGDVNAVHRRIPNVASARVVVR